MGNLRDHMFAAFERLGAEDLSEEDLKKEILRSQAISEVGKVIVESAKTQVMYAKLTRQREEQPDKFLEEKIDETPVPKIERPKAEYSNRSSMNIVSGE